MTIGSSQDHRKVENLGIVAHICAAAPGGPRYDPNMTPEERAGEENGLLLCRYCAALVDADEKAYPPQLLRMWREEAYRLAAEALAVPADGAEDPRCWSVIHRLVRECFCSYQTHGKISGKANFRSSAGILYRLFFEELPQEADDREQLALWARTMGGICADSLEPVSCRISNHDYGFPHRYHLLMEELNTYPLRFGEQKAQILNHMEAEIRELFRTGAAFGLNRNAQSEGA